MIKICCWLKNYFFLNISMGILRQCRFNHFFLKPLQPFRVLLLPHPLVHLQTGIMHHNVIQYIKNTEQFNTSSLWLLYYANLPVHKGFGPSPGPPDCISNIYRKCNKKWVCIFQQMNKPGTNYFSLLKQTVQRDFRPPVFFIIRTSLGH